MNSAHHRCLITFEGKLKKTCSQQESMPDSPAVSSCGICSCNFYDQERPIERCVPCSVILSVAQLQKPKESLAKKLLQVISRFQRSSKKKKLFSFTPCCLGAYWTCGGLLSTYQLPEPLISLKFLRLLSKLGFNRWLEGSNLQLDQPITVSGTCDGKVCRDVSTLYVITHGWGK